MYIYLYYPGQNKFYLKVFLDKYFNLYWQASHLFKMLGLKKDVKKRLLVFLGRHERLLRVKDITDCPKNNIFVLTTSQTERLITRTRMYGCSNSPFATWWGRLVDGKQYLRAKDPDIFKQVVRHDPFSYHGFAAECVYLREDGTANLSKAWTASDPTETAAADDPTEVEEAAVIEAASAAEKSSTAAAESPDQNREVFTLPSFVRNMRVGHRRPPRTYDIPSPTSSATRDPENNYTSSTTFSSPSSSERADIEIDDSKSFIWNDPIFKTGYKFVAVKVSWESGTRSICISPFYFKHNDESYLYIPTKINK